MKKLIIIGLCLYLASCATSENTGEDAAPASGQSTQQYNDEASKVDVLDTGKSERKPEVKTPPPPVPASMYSNLDNAIKSGNDDSTQKAASEILMSNSKDIRGLNALAVVNYKKGRFDSAQYLLNKAIAISPGSSELYGNLGLVYLAKNDRKEAIKFFRKALEVNSQDAIAGADLGSIYVQERDYNKAVLALEIPYKKGFKDPKILNNYAISLTATGKPKEAAEIYERILKENPSQREAMLNYSILLIENLGKNREGLDLLNRLKFVGAPQESVVTIKNLEIKAKAGLQ